MKLKYSYLLIFLMGLSMHVLAQEQFQLKGSYKLDSSVKKPVEFTLLWNEENNKINGTYQDNYFSKSAGVVGDRQNFGRTFVVTFPETTKGVKSITLLSSQVEGSVSGTTIPVSVITRDLPGNPLTVTEASSQFVMVSPMLAQKQEEALCREGFGVLQGYCGVYEGLITEEIDRGEQCNLLYAEAVRLELNFMGDLNLYLGEVNEVVSIPIHRIGRIPSNPETNNIDVLSRSCRPVSGTSFPGDNCKRLHLIGRFSTVNVTKHFAGVYSITDELTGNVCRYSLSMDLR